MMTKIWKKYELIANLSVTKFCKFHCVARKIDRDRTFPATQFNMESYGVIAHHWLVLYKCCIFILFAGLLAYENRLNLQWDNEAWLVQCRAETSPVRCKWADGLLVRPCHSAWCTTIVLRWARTTSRAAAWYLDQGKKRIWIEAITIRSRFGPVTR